jgi:hypothetical protein
VDMRGAPDSPGSHRGGLPGPHFLSSGSRRRKTR